MIWKRTKIGQFLNEREGKFKPKESNLMNLQRIEKIDFEGNIHLVANKPTKTDMIVIKKGDLVISGINAEKGAISIYKEDNDVMATIHYSSYTFNENQININYFKWFLRSKIFIDILKTQSKGGIKTELKAKKLLQLVINLPDLNGQLEILNKIESIEFEFESLLKNQEATSLYLTKLKQAILQDAIKGELTETWRTNYPELISGDNSAENLLIRIKAEKAQLIKDGKIKKEKPLPPITKKEILFELPEDWVWCRMQDITRLITDGKHGNCVDERNSGYYFLSAKDLQKGELIYRNSRQINFKEFQEVHNRTNLEPGDLCIVNTGGTVGKTAIVKDNEFTRKTTFQKSVAVVKPFKKGIIAEYLNIFVIVETPNLLKTSRGSAINNLLLGDMKKVCIPLPPLEEQKAIIEKVEQLMQKCQALEKEIKQSETNAQMLMQAVLKEAFEA